MGDFWVEHTQMWLNNTFGDHEDWIRLKENGFTGTNTMEGLIRAFQINNGILPATGGLGPRTLQKFKELPKISKMDPDDPENINVFIIQGALFCKGYNAGGLTGIYYNTGIAAIKKLQSDASIEETGVIGWKEWAALLSMNWFTLVDGGNPIVRTIQRQLNNEFSNEIGVGPCDGIISRHTALSLIAALQAAEGLDVADDLNDVNFGDGTTNHFPNPPLKIDQNTEYYRKFNRILQYGLYFNGYDPMRFDGVFDAKTQMCVNQFQQDYGLLGIGLVNQGIVNVSTMKSLLTSKGDTNRKAYACDCATILNSTQAKDLKNSGYTHVGRYLTGTVGVGADERPKALTLDEINNIKNAGLSLFPIYQDGGNYPEYFRKDSQGSHDAITAITTALKLGIPYGTTIYFAVDFDCYGYDIEDSIIPYFKEIKTYFEHIDYNIKNYKIGIYAPRYVCSRISEENLASTSFVCDMSTGFSGNLGFPIPSNWAFDQFNEFTFSSTPSFPIDKDAYSGRDKGCSNFDPSIEPIDKELLEKLKDKSNGKKLGITLGGPLGQETIINLGICTFKYSMSLTNQIQGENVTVDFEHTPTPSNPNLTKINGLTLEDKPFGISLTKEQEISLYAYIVNFDKAQVKLKTTFQNKKIKLELESILSLTIDDNTIQLSELFTIEFNEPDLDSVIESIKSFFNEHSLIVVGGALVAIAIIAFISLPVSVPAGIASAISAFIAGLSSLIPIAA